MLHIHKLISVLTTTYHRRNFWSHFKRENWGIDHLVEIITYLLNSWAGFYGTLIFLNKLRRTLSCGRFCLTDFELQRVTWVSLSLTWLFALLNRQSLKELRERSFRKTLGGGSSSRLGEGAVCRGWRQAWKPATWILILKMKRCAGWVTPWEGQTSVTSSRSGGSLFRRPRARPSNFNIRRRKLIPWGWRFDLCLWSSLKVNNHKDDLKGLKWSKPTSVLQNSRGMETWGDWKSFMTFVNLFLVD